MHSGLESSRACARPAVARPKRRACRDLGVGVKGSADSLMTQRRPSSARWTTPLPSRARPRSGRGAPMGCPVAWWKGSGGRLRPPAASAEAGVPRRDGFRLSPDLRLHHVALWSRGRVTGEGCAPDRARGRRLPRRSRLMGLRAVARRAYPDRHSRPLPPLPPRGDRGVDRGDRGGWIDPGP